MNASVDPELPVIAVRGLRTQFGAEIIHDALDFEVRRGEIIALVGGSGSGKTTLLRAIIMLLKPTAGSIKLLGQEVIGINDSAAFRLRRRFGMLFQQGALFSSLTVRENVAAPLREHTQLPASLIAEIANLKIVLAGLSSDTGNKLPRELSGGMLKRAALARALALDPALLFLDEPTAGLDPVSAGAFDQLVVQLKDSLDLTVVMVTHDLDTLWQATDRVAFLGEKRVIGYAPMRELTVTDHPLIQAYFAGPRGRAAREQAFAK
jgi:phospholipid/cholesterol/gamma-HCH transport system ATP-binding protein